MAQKKKRKNKNESQIADHKRHKKELTPPFLQLPKLSTSSWTNDRLPEMLWAVLVIGNMKREDALSFFRYIGVFVHENQDCWDITLSGISQWDKGKRKKFLEYISAYSIDMKPILRPLMLFENLPARADWETLLGQANPEDGTHVSSGVALTFWHQSQEATDCRWIRLMAILFGGKLILPSSRKEHGLELIEYPNRGDQKAVRPSIRAAEISYAIENPAWALSFWKECFDKTECMPEEAVNEKLGQRRAKMVEESKKVREYYLKHAKEVRDELITHLLNTSQVSSLDSRHEGIFGLALYGMTVFIETIFYRTSSSVTGRLSLRVLLETLITLDYGLKKEKIDPMVWTAYRSYGAGQLKLIHLKFGELSEVVSCIDRKDLEYNVNEDKWIEFVPINLGHWDGKDLRKMSEEVGLKAWYDSYHDYASGFGHASWGAVRESVYQRCMNPLHRFHRLPTFDLPLMPSIFEDARNLINRILNCVSKAYPDFNEQVSVPEVDMSCHI